MAGYSQRRLKLNNWHSCMTLKGLCHCRYVFVSYSYRHSQLRLLSRLFGLRRLQFLHPMASNTSCYSFGCRMNH